MRQTRIRRSIAQRRRSVKPRKSSRINSITSHHKLPALRGHQLRMFRRIEPELKRIGDPRYRSSIEKYTIILIQQTGSALPYKRVTAEKGLERLGVKQQVLNLLNPPARNPFANVTGSTFTQTVRQMPTQKTRKSKLSPVSRRREMAEKYRKKFNLPVDPEFEDVFKRRAERKTRSRLASGFKKRNKKTKRRGRKSKTRKSNKK